jgi:hypothetical protein
VIELYAVTDHPTPPLPDVAPLQLAPSRDLAAVYAPAGDGKVSAEALWRHEEVVEALMRDRDLLPVRFGTRLPDEAAAARVVADRRDALAEALQRVRGAVELAVRVVPAAIEEREPPAGGAAYLRERRAAADAAAAIHEPLSRLARASAKRPSPVHGEVLRAAYLVDRDAVDGFRGAVADLQHEHPRLRILCTGPWPPYSFAEP